VCAFNHSMTFVECVSEVSAILPWLIIHFNGVYFNRTDILLVYCKW